MNPDDLTPAVAAHLAALHAGVMEAVELTRTGCMDLEQFRDAAYRGADNDRDVLAVTATLLTMAGEALRAALDCTCPAHVNDRPGPDGLIPYEALATGPMLTGAPLHSDSGVAVVRTVVAHLNGDPIEDHVRAAYDRGPQAFARYAFHTLGMFVRTHRWHGPVLNPARVPR